MLIRSSTDANYIPMAFEQRSQHYKPSLRTLSPVGPVKSYRNFWEALSLVDEAPIGGQREKVIF